MADRWESRQVTVPDSAAGGKAIKILSRNLKRIEAWLYNNTAVTLYLGANSAVTPNADSVNAGFPMPNGSSYVIDKTTAEIWAIASGGTVDLRIVEFSEPLPGQRRP